MGIVIAPPPNPGQFLVGYMDFLQRRRREEELEREREREAQRQRLTVGLAAGAGAIGGGLLAAAPAAAAGGTAAGGAMLGGAGAAASTTGGLAFSIPAALTGASLGARFGEAVAAGDVGGAVHAGAALGTDVYGRRQSQQYFASQVKAGHIDQPTADFLQSLPLQQQQAYALSTSRDVQHQQDILERMFLADTGMTRDELEKAASALGVSPNEYLGALQQQQATLKAKQAADAAVMKDKALTEYRSGELARMGLEERHTEADRAEFAKYDDAEKALDQLPLYEWQRRLARLQLQQQKARILEKKSTRLVKPSPFQTLDDGTIVTSLPGVRVLSRAPRTAPAVGPNYADTFRGALEDVNANELLGLQALGLPEDGPPLTETQKRDAATILTQREIKAWNQSMTGAAEAKAPPQGAPGAGGPQTQQPTAQPQPQPPPAPETTVPREILVPLAQTFHRWKQTGGELKASDVERLYPVALALVEWMAKNYPDGKNVPVNADLIEFVGEIIQAGE